MVENHTQVPYLYVNSVSLRLFKQSPKMHSFNCNNCTVCWNALGEVVVPFNY